MAELYGVETKRVNEAARNSQDKFLEDFYFELTDKELKICGRKIRLQNFPRPEELRCLVLNPKL